jgi:ABC-2 type transport system permease protein
MIASAPADREAYLVPVPFTRLVRAEWRKTTDTRAARWLLAATALTTIGGLAVPLTFPHNVAQTRASYLLWAGLGLSRLLPIALMLAMTAEWSQRTALTTFTLAPRRGRVLAARIVTGLGLSAAAGLAAFGAAELTVTLARDLGRSISTSLSWPQLAGFAAFVLLTSAIGVAVGAALHNTAVAIVTYFGLAAAFSLLMIPAVARAGDWVNTGQTFGWVLAGQWAGHGAEIATSTALWVALPLAFGLIRTIRREVR